MTMDFNADVVKTNISANGLSFAEKNIDDDTKCARLSEVQSYTFDRNYLLVGILFKVTHVCHNKTEADFKGPMMKRQKKNYNRMFQFGTLGGNCFCVICDNKSISQHFCKYLTGIGVGQIVVLADPWPVKDQELRIDMPILRTSQPMYPLKLQSYAFTLTIQLKHPGQGGETTFFLYHNVQIDFTRAELRGKGDMYAPSCKGLLCDKKDTQKVNSACGCFTPESHMSPVVLEYTIKFKAPALFTDPLISERSYRTSRLFLKDISSLGLMQPEERYDEMKTIMACMEKCSDYINSNDGYTVCGTLSKGLVGDMSDETVKIASEKSTCHITYLMPTNIDIISNKEYENLMYNYSMELRY